MANTRHLSILFVDDDPDEHVLLERSARQVTRFEISVETVADPEVARSRIDERAHDVYLVDHYLAGATGLDLISEATAAGNPGPFILLTG